MSTAKLLLLRITAPGSIALLCTVPFWLSQHDAAAKIPDYVIALFPFVVGGCYYAGGLRKRLWDAFLEVSHEHIKGRLAEALRHTPDLMDAAKEFENGEVMNVFFNLVDTDHSLSERGNRVRMNGGVLTTIIDAILMLTFFCFVYLVVALLLGNTTFALLAMLAGMLVYELTFMEKRVAKKHIKLQDEQLGYIIQLRSAKVAELVKRTIQSRKSTS